MEVGLEANDIIENTTQVAATAVRKTIFIITPWGATLGCNISRAT
jgi:hypothetical protein